MVSLRKRNGKGYVALELVAVASVIALLLAMGFMLYRSMRLAARVSVAESNLKQISTGMELYFRKFNSYPPQGSDLTVELAPFVESPDVFHNPLLEEDNPGETVNKLYMQPSLEDLDSPDNYVTAMIADNGRTSVILKTGHKVERHDDIHFDPGAPGEDLVTILDPPQDEEPGDGDGDQDDGDDDDDGDDADDPAPPDDPGVNASPDDYTEEMPAGVVTPKDCFEAEFQVLVADLTWGANGPEVPITVAATYHSKDPNRHRNRHRHRVQSNNGHGNNDDHDDEDNPGQGGGNHGADDDYDDDGYDDDENGGGSGEGPCRLDLFGGQDVDGGETETHLVRSEESFTLEATASYGSWSVTHSSDGSIAQVLTLRNGDLPAQFDPYQNALPLGEALGALIDAATGTVTIGDNQVLYLFELGCDTPGQPGFDFQDLVIVVTLREPADTTECEDAEGAEEEDDDGFEFDDGEVETKMCSDIRIDAIGSQFGYADGTLVDIAAAAKIGDEEWMDLYGGQPVNGGESYSRASVPAGTTIIVKGEIIGSYERWLWSHYGYPLAYTSNAGSGQVLTLRRGDVPERFEPGYPYQAAVGDLLEPYVDPDTGAVTIAENEALYLWDFNPLHTNTGIDFQDLIILATAVAAEVECEGEDEGDGETDPPADPARPVLVLSPDGLETDNPSFSLQLANTATEEKDVAGNVQVNVQVIEGDQYVQDINCTAAVGTIAAGQTLAFPVSLDMRSAWTTAYDQQVRLRVTILNEDNWPEQNENKSIVVTINGPEAPLPVLELTPGNIRTQGRQESFKIENTAPAGADAKNVCVSVSVLSGSQYVDRVSYNASIGTIRGGRDKYFSVKVYTKSQPWRRASSGTEICLRIQITGESNNPDENVGKTALYTVYK